MSVAATKTSDPLVGEPGRLVAVGLLAAGAYNAVRCKSAGKPVDSADLLAAQRVLELLSAARETLSYVDSNGSKGMLDPTANLSDVEFTVDAVSEQRPSESATSVLEDMTAALKELVAGSLPSNHLVLESLLKAIAEAATTQAGTVGEAMS
jgi:hypothetical protein